MRLRTVGFRGLQMDDLFAFVVLIMYTCDAATVHLVCTSRLEPRPPASRVCALLTADKISWDPMWKRPSFSCREVWLTRRQRAPHAEDKRLTGGPTTALTPQEVEQYTLGSKLQLTAWYSYTALLWSLKGTMLFFFRRITTGLWQARLVRWLSWACLGSYLAVVLTVPSSRPPPTSHSSRALQLTFGCFPTSKNWQ